MRDLACRRWKQPLPVPESLGYADQLYLSALDVSSERFLFDTQFFGGADTSITLGALTWAMRRASRNSCLLTEARVLTTRGISSTGWLARYVAVVALWLT